MKISVIGAGAIGSMLGGLIQRDAPESEVVLIVRGPHGEAINASGAIELVGPWGNHRQPIRSSSDIREIAGSDIVVVTTKSQVTEAALQSAQPHLGDAIVGSIQNGINDHTFKRHVSPDRLVMGMTTTNMAIAVPGRVDLQLDGLTVFGPPAGGTMHEGVDRVRDAFRQIRSPGLTFESHANALGMRYNKLIINALGYASCLSESNFITEALFHRGWRNAVAWPLVRECRRILDAAGVQIQSMPGRSDLAKIERLMNVLANPVIGPLLRLAIRRRFERQPIVFSLYQDLVRGKPTEVHHINGEIVRLAESVGETSPISAPINAAIVNMVDELNQQATSPPEFFRREEVIARLEGVLKQYPA